MVYNNHKNIDGELEEIRNLIDKFNGACHRISIEIFINKTNETEKITLEQILKMVCKKTGLTHDQIRTKTRFQNILIPRQVCHYLGQKRTTKNLSEVGLFFGNNDHATVLNSCKKIQNLIDTEKEFRDYWRGIIDS